MYALVDIDPTPIIGQLIVTGGAIIVVGLPLWIKVRRGVDAAEVTRDNVGTTNGNGDLATMMTKSLENHIKLLNGQASLTQRAIDHETLDEIRFREISERLDKIESGTN